MIDNKLLNNFNSNPPADMMSVNRIKTDIGIELPNDYIEFMIHSNGGEGFIGSDSYIIIWKLEDLFELNNAYQVPEYAPGIFLFGSDGGGDAYGFDIRTNDVKIISIPFVGMDINLIKILGADFTSFINYLFNT